MNFADAKPHASRSHLTHISDGLHYDPLYKVLLINRNNHQVLVARPEKKNLKFFPAPVAEKKK